MRFEWDQAKAVQNVAKHGVSFEEAATVFNDDFSITIPDEMHSIEEDREFIIGVSSEWRLIVVVHTTRGETIRIISVRPAVRRERWQYEQHLFDYLI